MVIPSGSDFGHPVFTIWIISFSSPCVSESTATNGIYPYEEHKHDDSEDRELVPIPSYIFKHTSLAGITLIAQYSGGIVPPVAIRVLVYHCFHVVSASSWWFTTSRLHGPQHKQLWLSIDHTSDNKGPPQKKKWNVLLPNKGYFVSSLHEYCYLYKIFWKVNQNPCVNKWKILIHNCKIEWLR